MWTWISTLLPILPKADARGIGPADWIWPEAEHPFMDQNAREAGSSARRKMAAFEPKTYLNLVEDERAAGVVDQRFPTAVWLSAKNGSGDEFLWWLVTYS